MTHYLLKRGSKFLQQNYYWGSFPHAFSEVDLMVVLPEAMNYRDRPQFVGEITGGELDSVVWKEV